MLEHPTKSNGICRAAEKLDMDFALVWPLRAVMDIDSNIDARRDLLGRLFYLISVHCEDAAGEAATGQGCQVPEPR
jgi:hypothetical protein